MTEWHGCDMLRKDIASHDHPRHLPSELHVHLGSNQKDLLARIIVLYGRELAAT